MNTGSSRLRGAMTDHGRKSFMQGRKCRNTGVIRRLWPWLDYKSLALRSDHRSRDMANHLSQFKVQCKVDEAEAISRGSQAISLAVAFSRSISGLDKQF